MYNYDTWNMWYTTTMIMVMVKYDIYTQNYGKTWKTLETHRKTLEKHGKTMEKHGKTLEKHGKTLEKHRTTLEKHGKTLEKT